MMKPEPRVTEKSMRAATQNRYTFRVDKRAKKSQIKKAIEDEHKVNVMAVETINVKKKGHWKKAFVTLKKGQKIEGFGGESEK